MKENKLLERISLGLAVISIFLTIYFSQSELFQIIFVSAFFIFLLAYFILRNSLLIRNNEENIKQSDERLGNMEKSINIYDRLNKLEKEVFKK